MENFVITIGRGYGSGGRTIGKMLAKELGINYYDKEILKLAARSSGINENYFKQADEQLKSSNILKISQNVYRGEKGGADEDFATNINLFSYQAKVLNELADRESFVVIGRCADYVLSGRKKLVRVFVHASQSHCIEQVNNMTSMAEKDIAQFIRITDMNRAKYYKFNTGKEWADARNYDLSLCTDNMTIESCVAVIKEYMKIKGILR